VLVFVPRCGACAACASGRPALCAAAAAANTSGELLGGGRRWGKLDGEVVHHHLGVSAFAEHVVVDRRSVVPIADDVPADTAALLGCALLTGAGAVLSTARVEPGESVAVLGLGGVGLCAVMGAAIAGAYPIVAIDPVAAKRELALELGATHALDSGGIGDAIVEILPDGVDHAIEAVGAAAVLADAWSITARGGTTVAVGLPHPSQQLSVPIVALVGEARRLLGSYLGGAVPERDIPRFVELWRAGRLPLERLHSASLGLDGLNRALDDLHEGRALRQIVHPST
jgi:alcohol dehydrogenase